MRVEVGLLPELTDLASSRVQDFGREPHDVTHIRLPRLLETQHIAGIVFRLAHHIRKVVREVVSSVLEVDLEPAGLKCPATKKGDQLVFGQIGPNPESVFLGSRGLEDAQQVV